MMYSKLKMKGMNVMLGEHGGKNPYRDFTARLKARLLGPEKTCNYLRAGKDASLIQNFEI